MDEERMAILQMLTESKISVEEANNLLVALEASYAEADDTAEAGAPFDWDMNDFFSRYPLPDIDAIIQQGVDNALDNAHKAFDKVAENFPFNHVFVWKK